MMAPHTKAIQQQKRTSSPKETPFKTPKPKKVKTVSFQMDTADVMARAMIFDEPGQSPITSSITFIITMALLT